MLYSAFAIALCLVLTAGRIPWDARAWKPLAFIGKCSYPIYLIHQLVGPAIANLFRVRLLPGAPAAVYDLIYLSADIITGILLSLFIEQYFLRIRDYFSFSRQIAEYPRNSTN
jgi:peptidoglycan/LPS O-acetylase OafA/YrhL